MCVRAWGRVRVYVTSTTTRNWYLWKFQYGAHDRVSSLRAFSIGSRGRIKTILESWTGERNLEENREDVYERLHIDERFVIDQEGTWWKEMLLKEKIPVRCRGVLMLEMRIMRTGKRIETRSSDVRRTWFNWNAFLFLFFLFFSKNIIVSKKAKRERFRRNYFYLREKFKINLSFFSSSYNSRLSLSVQLHK